MTAEEPFRTIIEPFRIHSVEPVRLPTRAERASAPEAAGYNLFELAAEDVPIDLLTDSGTGAMSAEQWAAIQRGNEAYAGAPSFHRFRAAVTGLFLDSCRIAENAWFIRTREPGYGNVPVAGIIRQMAALADGMTMSAKKDPLANIGGWLALNDDALAERCRNLQILTEGFPTYGGLAGRDLEAIAQGLREAVDHDYLRYRARSVEYLGEALEKVGVPVVVPFGGHAVFIDARAMLPHIDPLAYPGQALACALYLEGGVRSCEIGTVMFGLHPDGTETPAAMDLVRLAIPRRTYTQSHMDYVIEVVERVTYRASDLPGIRIVSQPRRLRHFTARFEPTT